MLRNPLIYLFTFCACVATAQKKVNFDSAHARFVVNTLASDSFAGRNPATPEIKLSVDFITGQFEKLDLKPAFNNSYLQEFLYPSGNDSIMAWNIMGFVRKPDPKKKTIILCAHYDHLGKDKKFSRDPASNQIHNGADDNACGVAMILELARALKANRKSEFNYLIIAFSGHETGLYGSDFYFRSPVNSSYPAYLVINFDLIGRMEKSSQTLIFCNGNLNDSLKYFSLKNNRDLFVKTDTTRLLSGDHRPFFQSGIPTVFMTCGEHDDYHKPTDDADRINYRGMEMIFRFTLEVLQFNERSNKR